MKFELIDQAKLEAYRFIARALNAQTRVKADKMVLITGCKETAALKRASMDLSKILSKLRKV